MKLVIDLGAAPYTIKRNIRRLARVAGKKRGFTELISIMVTDHVGQISIMDDKGNLTPYVERSAAMSPLQDALNIAGLTADDRTKNKTHRNPQTANSK